MGDSISPDGMQPMPRDPAKATSHPSLVHSPTELKTLSKRRSAARVARDLRLACLGSMACNTRIRAAEDDVCSLLAPPHRDPHREISSVKLCIT